MRCLNAKSKSIINHCKHIYLGMQYIRRVNKTIYEKAVKYTGNMNTVSYMHNNELEYSYRSSMILYQVTDLNDTMFDKCLNEQDDY